MQPLTGTRNCAASRSETTRPVLAVLLVLTVLLGGAGCAPQNVVGATSRWGGTPNDQFWVFVGRPVPAEVSDVHSEARSTARDVRFNLVFDMQADWLDELVSTAEYEPAPCTDPDFGRRFTGRGPSTPDVQARWRPWPTENSACYRLVSGRTGWSESASAAFMYVPDERTAEQGRVYLSGLGRI